MDAITRGLYNEAFSMERQILIAEQHLQQLVDLTSNELSLPASPDDEDYKEAQHGMNLLLNYYIKKIFNLRTEQQDLKQTYNNVPAPIGQKELSPFEVALNIGKPVNSIEQLDDLIRRAS